VYGVKSNTAAECSVQAQAWSNIAITIAVAPPSHASQLAYWAIVVTAVVSSLVALAWMAWLIHALQRDRRRHREGRCLHCGYDVRFSKGVCPECGRPIR
jgi:hypothetical protein